MEFPTNEEHELIKSAVMLPIVMSIIEHDIKAMPNLKMKSVYVAHLEKVLDDVHRDLVDIKKKLKKSGIHIFEQKKDDKQIYFSYKVRGYTHKASMLRFRLNAEVQEIIEGYLKSPSN